MEHRELKRKKDLVKIREKEKGKILNIVRKSDQGSLKKNGKTYLE